MFLRLQKKHLLFLVLTIMVGGLFLIFLSQKNIIEDIGLIELNWNPIEENPLVPGFLYTHTQSYGDITETFFISTDTLLSTSSLDIATGTLKLDFVSSFFNPNACSKMPNVILDEFMLFRDHIVSDKKADGLLDIFYAFNTDQKTLSQVIPSFNIVGDLYVYDDYLYFFFENNLNELYLAYSTTSATLFHTVPLTSSFIVERMKFYAAEPAFTYTIDEYSPSSKYVFDFKTKKFIRNDDYKKLSRISTVDGMLTFLFPGTEYTFIDDKQFLKREQMLLKNSEKKLTITGDVNIYPIGISLDEAAN